ncbi:MAG: NifB/NifX family molybdenum-iron cluster-binding protein [Dehalococcoidia bacterium]
MPVREARPVVMKIAISSEGADLESSVARLFGKSKYLLILDPESMEYEAVGNPGASGDRAPGMQAVVIAVSREVAAVLTGYCSPAAAAHLSSSGIQVIDNLSGTVKEAVEYYKEHFLTSGVPESVGGGIGRAEILNALASAARQFLNLAPILVGVVLLVGLFNALVSREALASVFSGNSVLDTLWGTFFGSILAGSPVNSYVIGGKLLDFDVSLHAITALIVAWVTVGLVQLPAEIGALGRRFAFARNGVAFLITIPLAILTATIVNLIKG